MRIFLTIVSLILSNAVIADVIGLRTSGGVFSYEVDGELRDSANIASTFDLKNDLGMQDDETFHGFAYIEHPLPILPNIRIGYTDLDIQGRGTVTATRDFNGVSYPIGTDVISNVDLSHTDIGLYYEVIDTIFDLDLGINAKLFDGQASLTDGTTSSSSKYDQIIPMLYAHVGVPLVGGLSLAGDMSYIEYDDDKVEDILVRLHYKTSMAFGIELGYRRLNIDYTDNLQHYDITVDGPYLSASFTF